MSATVCWRRIGQTHESFDVGAPSGFADIMKRRFGSEPWRVTSNDLDWLAGIRDSGDKHANWDEIIATVERTGGIEIWRAY